MFDGRAARAGDAAPVACAGNPLHAAFAGLRVNGIRRAENDAFPMNLRGDFVDDGGDFWIGRLRELAHRSGKVAWADADAVDTGYLKNFVKIPNRFNMFDLQNDKRRVFGGLFVFVPWDAAVAGATADAAAAVADGRIFAGGDGIAGLFRRADHRDDDACGSQIENRLDDAVFIPRDTDERCAIRAAAGHDVLFDLVNRERTMLRVNPCEIETDVACEFADG